MGETGISCEAVARAMDEDGGWWQSCSGCHETVDGHETGHYRYSDLFRCHVGSGCTDCGGLGVTWNYFTDEQYVAMAEEASQPEALDDGPEATADALDDIAATSGPAHADRCRRLAAVLRRPGFREAQS